MASAQGLRAGRAYVEVGVDNNPLSRGLRNASNEIKAFSSSLRAVGMSVAGLGASIAAPLVPAMQTLTDLGRQGDMAAALGLDAKRFTGLADVFSRVGLEAQDTSDVLTDVADWIQDAAVNGGELAETFRTMNIDASKLNGLAVDQQFLAIADALSKLDPTLAAGLAARLGGDFQKLLPIIRQGGAAIEEMAGRVGASSADVAQAVEANRAYGAALSQLNAAWRQVAVGLAPIFVELGGYVTQAAEFVGDLVKENKAWLPTVAKVALGIGLVGGALLGASAAVYGFAFVLGGLATAGTMVAAGIGAIAGAVAFLATPVGAITALVVGGIAAWMAWTDSGRAAAKTISGAIGSMVASVGDLLGSMAQTFTQAWGGIVDAVKAGNLSLAGSIAWKGMEIVWQKGVNWLRELWRGFSFYFVETFYQATTDLAHGLNDVWSGLEKFWFASFSTLRAGWNTTIDAIRKSYLMGVYNMKIAWLDWQHTVGAISKHTLTLEKTIAWTGDAEKGTEGTRQALEAITKERRAAEEKDKKALEEIESRRKAVEVGMDREHADGMAARERERNAARKKDLEELVQLEKELADAIKQANDAAAMARWEKTGSWFGFEDQAPTKKGLDAVAERATGMGASGGSAGTFDANVLRFLTGTGNKDLMQKKQLEEAEQTNRRLERLIDIARDNKNTYT